MLAAQGGVICGGAAAKRRKHVSNSNQDDPDGFSSVMRQPNRLAVAEGGTTVWIQNTAQWCRRQNEHHNAKPHESRTSPNPCLALRLTRGH